MTAAHCVFSRVVAAYAVSPRQNMFTGVIRVSREETGILQYEVTEEITVACITECCVVVITSLDQQDCSHQAVTRPHQHCPPLHVHIPRLSPSLLRLPPHKVAVEYPLLISSAYVRFGASSYRPSRYTYTASNGAAGSEVCPCLHLVNSLFLHTQSALAGR